VTLQAGTRLGPYEITALIGAGGMGEVYRAHDTKLNRDVAIKVLPEVVATDPDRLARFHREAQVLASLNHPNIAHIYGVEDSSSTHGLVMELVDGPTLADRITQGPLPLNEALPIARQIAEALETAHEQGIIHRDLKPANIKVRDDGTVKVLDFGLAKLIDPAVSSNANATMSPTLSLNATMAGVILGTAAYMAPEQARGLAVDRRADIWAWACVLFETLSGDRAFGGTDTTEVLAAVVRAEPDWTRLPADTSDSLRRLMRWCLTKDPRQRLAHIHDARLLLEDVQSEVARPSTRDKKAPPLERVIWASALVLCVTGAVLLWRTRPVARVDSSRELHVELATPPTYDLVSMAMSPNGQMLAYLASINGRSMLWLRSLMTGDARPLIGTDGASFPFWSPDSQSIGYFANERLYRIDTDGGSLTALTPAPVGTGGTWSRNGIILFTSVPDAPISRVSAAGGSADIVPGSDPRAGGNRFPQFLPDGRHYLYFMAGAGERGVYAGVLDGSERRRLFDADAAAVFVAPAHVLFVRAGTLFVQGFNTATLSLEGVAMALTKSVVVDSTGAAAISASSTGSLVYRVGSSNRQRQLAWFDRSGTQIGEEFPPDADGPSNPAISPDGRQVLLTRTVAGNVDVWVQDLMRVGALTRLTTAPTPDIYPIWSPDGKRIAYAGIGRGAFDIFVKSTTVDAQESLLLSSPLQEFPADWSRDGRFILYRQQDQSGNQDLWALPMDGFQKPFAVARTSADERMGQFSPDGKWVAIDSNESGRYEVYVQTFPIPTSKTVVSTEGGRQARWGPDGKELFYIAADGRLMAVSFRFRPDGQIEPASPVPLFMTRVTSTPAGGSVLEYDVARDGKQFLMNTLVEQAGNTTTLVLNPSWERQP
jgi:serine/threonine protein kinase/Tol biopolymer transport system component